MYGYKKVFHVWFKRNGEWYPVGVGKVLPIDIKEADNALEIAFEAYTRPGCQGALVMQVEDIPFSHLASRATLTYKNYEQLRPSAMFGDGGGPMMGSEPPF